MRTQLIISLAAGVLSLLGTSRALAQAWPGEKMMQAPAPGWQALHPSSTASALQQEPPRQAPEAQLALAAQAAPPGRLVVARQ
jgi:hypothetical protein